MTDVPANAASVLPDETPKAGGTGKIDAAAAFAQELVNDANQFQLSVQGAQSEFYGVKSKGIDKLDAKLGDRLMPGAQTLERSASESKAAFDTYAAEVTRINKDADRVVEQINDALATIRIAVGTIDEISRRIRSYQTYTWRDDPPGAMPDPRFGSDAADLTSAERTVEVQMLRSAYEYQWGVATSNWLSAVADINRAAQTWSTLIEERKSAEGALVKALEMTGIGELISINGGVSGLPAFTIAQRVSGELWGEESAALSLAKEHPLLENLLGTSDGERAFESPPHPDIVAANWAALSPEQQEQLIAEVPWVIGNLPGLPYSVRDRANRMLLEYYALHGGEMSAACSKAFAEVMQAVNADDGEPPVSVVALNLEGPVPLVAMGYGDLDSALNLTVESAGMFSNADAALPGWDTASKNLYAEQLQVLDKAGRLPEGNAVIVYLEYDTPDLVTVLMPFSARSGAERLALEIDGVFATRAANVPLPNLAALAHSYGTTTMANALTLVTHKVQSFTMLASAGLDGQKIKDFSDLKVESAPDGSPAVYTTMASKDYVARIGSSLSGRLQPNPEVASMWPTIDGAHQFSSDGAGEFNPTTGHPLLAADGGGYMDEGTQALWNSAAVTMGAADLVVGELNVTSTPVWQVAMQVTHELGVT